MVTRLNLPPGRVRLAEALALGLLLLALGAGCQTAPRADPKPQPFVFSRDTFAYPNELAWEYVRDPATGEMRAHRRTPPPDYSLRCFVVVRAARQFHTYAVFDPSRPKADRAEYKKLIDQVLKSPDRTSVAAPRVIIPGFRSLRQLSQQDPSLLRKECGGAWQSYLQRGNWRMIFPFSRRNQSAAAQRLEQELSAGELPIVHLVRFPQLTINHAILLFRAERHWSKIDFLGYDPNDIARPIHLVYDADDRRFFLPPTRYFAGGRADVYEIYRSWNY